MKANRPLRPTLILVSILALTFAASCSERRVEPSPAPTPSPLPLPAPPPPPPPPRPAANWLDAPITPGDWRWSMEAGQSVARFAGGLLELRCDRAAATVTLLRSGMAEGQVPMSVQTSSTSRSLSGTPIAGPPPMIAASFSARDNLLDAMAFSRGRFAVDVAGLQPLYVPSWPEVSRVVEDCR